MFALLSFGQVAAFDPPRDLVPSLEWKLLVSFWKFEATTWEKHLESSAVNGPIPTCPDRCHLFSQRNGAQRVAPVSFSRSAIDMNLKVGQGHFLDMEPLAESRHEMIKVGSDR